MIDLATLKKFLSKDDPSISPNSKSMSLKITIFKQLKKKIVHKTFFVPKNNIFVLCVFFSSTVGLISPSHSKLLLPLLA